MNYTSTTFSVDDPSSLGSWVGERKGSCPGGLAARPLQQWGPLLHLVLLPGDGGNTGPACKFKGSSAASALPWPSREPHPLLSLLDPCNTLQSHHKLIGTGTHKEIRIDTHRGFKWNGKARCLRMWTLHCQERGNNWAEWWRNSSNCLGERLLFVSGR